MVYGLFHVDGGTNPSKAEGDKWELMHENEQFNLHITWLYTKRGYASSSPGSWWAWHLVLGRELCPRVLS